MTLSVKDTHTIRTILALLVSYLIGQFINLDHEIWLYITVLVVLMPLPYSGSAAERALMRSLGTILGGAWAMTAQYIHLYLNQHWLFYSIILAGIIVGVRNATGKYPYAAFLFVLTLILVGIKPLDVLENGIWRIANVVLGCAIAYLFVFFPKPVKASEQWIQYLIKDLVLLRETLVELDNLDENRIRKKYVEFSDILISQRALIPHIQKERISKHLDVEIVQRILRRLLSTMEMISRTEWDYKDSEQVHILNESLRQFQLLIIRKIVLMETALKTGEWDYDNKQKELMEHYMDLRTPVAIDHSDYSIPANIWLHRQLSRLLNQLEDILRNAFVHHHQIELVKEV